MLLLFVLLLFNFSFCYNLSLTFNLFLFSFTFLSVSCTNNVSRLSVLFFCHLLLFCYFLLSVSLLWSGPGRGGGGFSIQYSFTLDFSYTYIKLFLPFLFFSCCLSLNAHDHKTGDLTFSHFCSIAKFPKIFNYYFFVIWIKNLSFTCSQSQVVTFLT